MAQYKFFRFTLIVVVLLQAACSNRRQNADQLKSWDKTLSELNISIKELQNRKEEGETVAQF